MKSKHNTKRKIQFTIEVSTENKEQAFVTGLVKHLNKVLSRKGTVYAIDTSIKEVSND